MEFTVDQERKGIQAAPRPRSVARQAMDRHADTGRWISTDVPNGELEAVKRRLYTLANKAGYSLRTETIRRDDISTLRLLVRSRGQARGVGVAS